MDATSSRSILAALAGNLSSGSGFSALAESVVVAVAEGRSADVSRAVGVAVGGGPGANASQVCCNPGAI